LTADVLMFRAFCRIECRVANYYYYYYYYYFIIIIIIIMSWPLQWRHYTGIVDCMRLLYTSRDSAAFPFAPFPFADKTM